MTAHSISILSELKMSSMALTRYQMHSVEDCAKCPTVPQLLELMIDTRAAGKGSK